MKKIYSAFLAAAIFGAATIPAGAFTGVSDWAKPSVNQAIAMGIVPDSLQDTQASKAISRAEFCEVAVGLYESISGQTASTNTVSPFTDTDNEVIAAASALGIVSGRGNGLFDPYSTITRQEFCVMLCNVTRAIDGKSNIVETNLIANFPDGDMVESWARADVETIIHDEIMTGILDLDGVTRLKPLATTSREQAMVMAVRFADHYGVQNDGQQETDNDYIIPEEDDITQSPDNDIETPENGNHDYETPEDEMQDYEIPYNPILPEEAASLTKEERLIRLFGKDEIGFESQEQAESAMTEITVPVWRLQSDGSKRVGQMTLNVNANLALVYQAIFEEIFSGNEQFPIKDGGSYAWRTNTRSEHRWGTAIDLNWNENMECYIDELGNVTQITTGSYWQPEEDPYSIPADGDVVRAFAKYGFAWGGDAWTSKRDYMHFSYFGT